ncbi:hypothetical protein CXF90_16425 [Stenotrophomonas sp. Betaine-02u-23]|nr:hypothetical protein CXF90_16425 [Stenotrophomonas sp. Betaine-02u-23]
MDLSGSSRQKKPSPSIARRGLGFKRAADQPPVPPVPPVRPVPPVPPVPPPPSPPPPPPPPPASFSPLELSPPML